MAPAFRPCTIKTGNGAKEFSSPLELHNEGYGDQEDKKPDVYAYDPSRRCYIIGEAKTGAGDLETEHALTQYNVFLDQFDKRSGDQAIFYIILPSGKVAEFNTLITHYIHRDYWGENRAGQFVTLEGLIRQDAVLRTSG